MIEILFLPNGLWILALYDPGQRLSPVAAIREL